MRFTIWVSLLLSSAAVHAQSPSVSTAEIQRLMAERQRIAGAGMVIGIIEPAGRRVITVGESGSPDRQPLDGNTIFQIGSVTKVFTTLLLADMVVRGEVSLDDAASNYLPSGARMPGGGRPINLLDLATHTSGLPSMPTNFSLHADPDPISAYTPRQLYEFLSSHRLETAPGERWSYSNLGVALLGRLLAQRSGTTYEKLLAERVLRPLGLRSTGITLTREQARRLASGHDRFGQPAETWEMRTLPASGSLRSSANDLLELLAVYLGSRESVLDRAVTLQLSTRAPVRNAQALGWGTSRIAGRELFVHDGGKAGYRSLIAFDREAGRGIVILENARSDERPGALALYLLTGKELPPARDAAAARQRINPGHRLLARYEGRYRLVSGRIVDVAAKRGYLVVDSPGEGPAKFVAAGDGDFFDPSGEEELAFDPAQSARTMSITWYERGKQAGAGVTGSRLSIR